ncbi:MAG: FtsX-like permease family protein, partial [Acidobacteria bacterium]
LKYGGLREPVMPTTYFPFSQMFYSRFRTTHLRTPYFAVRTALDPMAVVSGVRKAVGDIDSGVAITEVTTQEDVLDRGVSRERLFASLCGALAVLAVLLACIGLYGLLAYNLTRRTADIGVRMALGATRRRILWQVLRQALLLSLVGVILGVPASLALTHLIETQLFGVKPNDPFSLAGAAVSLITVALLAAWIPAHRAAKVDPIAALRSE